MTLTVDRLTSKWRLYFAKKSMYKYKLCVTTGCNYRPPPADPQCVWSEGSREPFAAGIEEILGLGPNTSPERGPYMVFSAGSVTSMRVTDRLPLLSCTLQMVRTDGRTDRLLLLLLLLLQLFGFVYIFPGVTRG